MARKDSYNRTTSFKVNSEQQEYIKKLKADGISLRDVLEYYRINNTNETKRLVNREKYLIREIPRLEKELELAKEELIEVRTKLGKAPTENQETLDIIEAREIILERAKSKYGNKLDKTTLNDYLTSKEADRVLAPTIHKYNIRDIEEWKEILKKKLKL